MTIAPGDSRNGRIKALKIVIGQLRAGDHVESVRTQLAALVSECDASDIAAMAQQLLAEGVPLAQMVGRCDLQAQVVTGVLAQAPSAAVPPGHPVDTFQRENAALREAIARLRWALAALGSASADAPPDPRALQHVGAPHSLAGDVDRHYRRKERLLLPFLERHGLDGPSAVMSGKDDEARGLLADLGTTLEVAEGTPVWWRLVAQTVAEPALAAVEKMIFKEERILFPLALQHLTDAEWREIRLALG